MPIRNEGGTPVKQRVISGFIVLVSILFVLQGCGSQTTDTGSDDQQGGIKVGVVFSLSGPTAVLEQPMADAVLLAMEEINANGGVKGKKLVPIQEDYAGDPSQAATKAKKLLQQDQVAAIIGGLTSSSRTAMLPVVEQNNGVLIYPTSYEGEEYSKNIIYTGAVPNQQIQDLIPWLVNNEGKKFFLIGNDYNYPVQTNKQVKAILQKLGGEVVGEEYVPLGHSEFASLVNKIKSQQPDVVFSTLIGNSAPPFFKQFKSYGLSSENITIASPALGPTEVQGMGIEAAEGHISAQAYFPEIGTPENETFVEAYGKKYGKDIPVNYLMEAAYYSTHLLAESLEKVDDANHSEQLIQAFAGLEIDAPQGKIKVDPENNHMWLYSRVARVGSDGQFDILLESKQAIQPEPWAKLIFPDAPEPWKN